MDLSKKGQQYGKCFQVMTLSWVPLRYVQFVRLSLFLSVMSGTTGRWQTQLGLGNMSRSSELSNVLLMCSTSFGHTCNNLLAFLDMSFAKFNSYHIIFAVSSSLWLLMAWHVFGLRPSVTVTTAKVVWAFRLCSITLKWRPNERDGVSNHQPHHCLLNR